MKKRLITGLVFILTIALGLVLKFYVSNYFFDVLILAIACIGGFETSRLFSKMGRTNDKIMAISYPVFSMVMLLLCIALDNKIGIVFSLVILIATMVLFFFLTFIISLLSKNTTILEMKNQKVAISKPKYCLKKALNTVLTFIYPSFLILFLTFINHFEDMSTSFPVMGEFNGRLSLFVLLFTLLIPILTDTFAYLTGSIIGGKKLAPNISPNKTISGAVGGVVWCVLFSITVFCLFNAFPTYNDVFSDAGITLWKVSIISLLGSILSQSGDLFESFLKRSAKVKDSGKILPGHGGILDRFDSHIAVAPFIFIAFAIIFVVV